MMDVVLGGAGLFALMAFLIFKCLPEGPAPGPQPDGSFVILTPFCALRLPAPPTPIHPEHFAIEYEEGRARIRAEHAGRQMFEYGGGI